MADTLPEGTDQIIPGATSTRDRLKDEAADLRDRATSKASEFKSQASDKAMDFAEQGKAHASGALDEVARMIGQTAGTIDEKLGGTYGDYARRAADAVSGAAGTLRDKDVDELFEDARDLVRRSPAVAIGAAAAAGFVIARIIKAGSDALDGVAKNATPSAKAKSEAVAKTVTKAARKAPSKSRAKPKSASDA